MLRMFRVVDRDAVKFRNYPLLRGYMGVTTCGRRRGRAHGGLAGIELVILWLMGRICGLPSFSMPSG
jgi:hypothetical protein